MASKVLVCFGGPRDGQRLGVSDYMKKVKDDKGNVYLRRRFYCENSWKEALIYQLLEKDRINVQVVCRCISESGENGDI